MKRLTLLRHAKSDWGDPEIEDAERPINARGHEAAKAMGEELRRLGLAFDLVLASPARRVAETLAGAGIEGSSVEPAIYAASGEGLLAVVRALPDSKNAVLLAGHHPGLPDLALSLSDGDQGEERRAIEEKYPTAALAELALAIERWSDAGVGCGSVERFVRPRDL